MNECADAYANVNSAALEANQLLQRESIDRLWPLCWAGFGLMALEIVLSLCIFCCALMAKGCSRAISCDCDFGGFMKLYKVGN